MAIRRAPWEKPLPPPPSKPVGMQGEPVPFGLLVRAYRIRSGLSQNLLARRAGIDPAYINRLERQQGDQVAAPSRRVVLSLYKVLVDACHEHGIPIDSDDREQLLASAGLCPQVIVDAGGWDSYVRTLRAEVLNGLTQTLERFDTALAPREEDACPNKND